MADPTNWLDARTALSLLNNPITDPGLIVQCESPDEMIMLIERLGELLADDQRRFVVGYEVDCVQQWYTVNREMCAQARSVFGRIAFGASAQQVRDQTPQWSDSSVQFMRMAQVEGLLHIRELCHTRTAASGAWLSFTHDYDDKHLTSELAKLGCYRSVEESQGDANCLIEALRHSSLVHPKKDAVINHLMACCVSGEIPYKALQEVHETLDVQFSVKIIRAGRVNQTRLIPKNADPEQCFKICLLPEQKHWVADIRMKMHRYAVHNFDTLKDKEFWWQIGGADGKRRWSAKNQERTIKSYELLCFVENSAHAHRIGRDCHELYKTPYFDKLKDQQFDCLDYPECAVRPVKTKERNARKVAGAIVIDIEASTRLHSNPQEVIDDCWSMIYQDAALTRIAHAKVQRCEPDDLVAQAEALTSLVPHGAYMLCMEDLDKDDTARTFHGPKCGIDFLNWLAANRGMLVAHTRGPDGKEKQRPPKIIVMAHNATYDYQVLLEHCSRIQLVQDGTKIICGSARFYGFLPGYKTNKHWTHQRNMDACRTVVEIEFLDTYKVISMPLRQFGKAFKLDCEKEVMCHGWYTRENVRRAREGTFINPLTEVRPLMSEDDYKEFMHHMRRLELYDPRQRTVDMLGYAEWYCKQDVRVLKAGYNEFRRRMVDYCELDPINYPTISGLADEILKKEGCYDDTEEVSGVVLQYISQAATGGRTMLANNERCIAYDLADYDAVSLYPSSMHFAPGFLIGRPEVWTPEIDIHQCDGFFITIRVTNLARPLDFPTLYLPTEEGGNHWTNDLIGEQITLDRFSLQSAVEFQGLEYEILHGYVYRNGRNTKIKDTILDMFEQRKKLKNERDEHGNKVGNPLQHCLKLCLNSCYGKCGEKVHDTTVKYVNQKKLDMFLRSNFNAVKNVTQVGKYEYRVELRTAIHNHYNRVHISCEITSYSKLMMNRLLSLCQQLNIKVYYSDTDSMFIDRKGLERLKAAMRDKYGFEIDGSNMGQFHTDLEFEGGWERRADGMLVPTTRKPEGEIYVEKGIFIAKKTYLLRLKDQAGQSVYQFRSKGQAAEAVQGTVNLWDGCFPGERLYAPMWDTTSKYKGDIEKMYMDLYNEEKVYVDHSIKPLPERCEPRCVMRVNKAHKVVTVGLSRIMHFPRDRPINIKRLKRAGAPLAPSPKRRAPSSTAGSSDSAE